MRPRRVGLVVATVLLAGCGGAPASAVPSATVLRTFAPTLGPSASPPAVSAPAPAPGDGLPRNGRIELPEAGLALTLPATWTRVGPDPADIEAALEGADPAGVQQLIAQVQSMVPGGLVLFAIGPDVLRTGYTVAVVRSDGIGLSLDALERQTQAQLAGSGATDIVIERIDLPAGPALAVALTVPTGVDGPEIRVHQFLVATGTHLIALSINASTPEEAAAIAATLELLDD